MRKSFKVIALVLIFPVITYSFTVNNVCEVSTPDPATSPVANKTLQFSHANICINRFGENQCFKA